MTAEQRRREQQLNVSQLNRKEEISPDEETHWGFLYEREHGQSANDCRGLGLSPMMATHTKVMTGESADYDSQVLPIVQQFLSGK